MPLTGDLASAIDSLATSEHVLLGQMLFRAPKCALIGCAATASDIVPYYSAWVWYCRAHLRALYAGQLYLPGAPA